MLRHLAGSSPFVGLEPLEERALLANVPSGFVDTPVVSGLTSPTSMVFAPDGRIFITEQHGAIKIVKHGKVLSKPFATITDLDSAAERGLLGIELDPKFSSNGFVYIYYTSNQGTVHNRVARLTARGDVAAKGSQVNLLDLPPINDAIYHMGGALHFGLDGDLYIGVGDHLWFDGNQLQSLTIPFGKVLRIKSDGSIPTDNPWYNQAKGINRAAWAMGFRNPFTFAFQPGTGRLFIDDVGQETWEEIDDGKPGANYGWPTSEGPDNLSGFTAPIYYYKHDPGCAIVGGVFYNPDTRQFPSKYTGRYFFADLCDGQLNTLDPAHGNAVARFATGLQTPVDFDLAADGSLYYLQRGADTNHDIEQGSIGRISYTKSTPGTAPPAILSQPQSVKVASGAAATFSVSASGTGLKYQWTRNNRDIPGATGVSYTIDKVKASDAGTFRVRVSNSADSVTSSAASLSVLAEESAPTARIVSPGNGTTFRAGQTITFNGRASDAEDGGLGASAFTWEVDYHTGSVDRPLMQATSGVRSGSFTIPTESPYKETNVFYRVLLTVKDSSGASTTVFRDITPQVASVRVTSNVPGVKVMVDEQPKPTPMKFAGVAGLTRVISAPSKVTYKGQNYVFKSWSDGGAQEHAIATPAKNTTYVANYKKQSPAQPPPPPAPPPPPPPEPPPTQTVTIAVSDDAYVFAGTPVNNFGAASVLNVRAERNSSGRQDTFLKFDLAQLSGKQINSAKLRLFGTLDASTDSVPISVYAADGAKWTQSSLTWNNRPSADDIPLATATVLGGHRRWYEWDLSTYLKKQQSLGRSSVTLVVRNLSGRGAGASFNSSESGSNPPELKLSVAG
jgi:glucose/arabinose dehydrogenase